MLSRLIPKPSHFRFLYTLSSKSHSHSHHPHIPTSTFIKHFSSSNNNNGDPPSSNIWKLTTDDKFDSVFTEDSTNDSNLSGFNDSSSPVQEPSWADAKPDQDYAINDIFINADTAPAVTNAAGNENEWLKSEMWSLEDDKEISVFDIGEETPQTEIAAADVEAEKEKEEKRKLLEQEEKELMPILKGPSRAFGDLIAASGITDDMLDSLIALRDFEGIEGLPPLTEIEDMRYEKNTRKSTRAEIERQKQEEVAKARVRQVDDKGRAYGTGRRKCSIARVWIEPGDGKFLINDKQIDVCFPMLDHRAALLQPFSETKTLGLWDVKCTVKGGGTTGQVGAIQLGISRAMQNWEPDLRPPLRNAGLLTRDSRVVERKKPGKAKARKSFQWVKR